MMIMKRLLFLVSVCSLCMVGNSQNYQPEKHAVVKSDRGDGRLLTYIIHSGFISGYQNRYGDNLKPPTNVYHRMTA